MNYRSYLKKTNGFSLLEMMVSLGIISIVFVAGTSLLGVYSQHLRQVNFQATLQTLHSQFLDNINSGGSWQNTITDSLARNASMACIRNKTACATGALNNLVLYTQSNTVFFDPTVPTNGFSSEGLPCGNFDPVGGSDTCPISYTVTWEALCTGVAACINPGVRVRVTALLRPAGSTVGSIETNKNWGNINLRRFDIDLNRNRPEVDEPFRVAEVANAAGATGTCATPRVFNSIVSDPMNNVGLDAGNVVINKAGTFKCKILVPGFSVGGFRARLFNVTSGVDLTNSSVSGRAELNSQDILTLEANFTAAAGDRLRVDQFCEADNPYAKGMPVKTGAGTYGDTVLSSMTCSRIY